ncbi:UDP-N-acetylmuramate--alanine ligase [Achromatium sp. WMS3]|nr:UDP-N-acetylmuramate--alanine ligase [Achromatium sp. WMS3]
MTSLDIAYHPADRMGRIQNLHFVGIGGAGMSGIAEVLLTLGYRISGSDLKENTATLRLSNLGAAISLGHRAENLKGADAIVISSAVDKNNPEIQAAQSERIPVVPRAEMLAELMRFHYGIAIAGTHGKTTTTSLISSLLAEAGLDPTFVIGGLLNSTGANARLGKGRYLVAEADESDASFLYLQPKLAVVTNIDADHMDTYSNDFNKLRSTFIEFLHHLPFYGLAVLCIDDIEVQALLPAISRKIKTYGTHPDADVRAQAIHYTGQQSYFTLVMDKSEPVSVTLNLPGHHNVLNALAAITVALELSIPQTTILQVLANFQGIDRRFQITQGQTKAGHNLILVDDYAHHPNEIAATIAAAKSGWPNRRLVLVFQPHRYTRTRDCLENFAHILSQVDLLILTEVYPAGEMPIPGADGRSLTRLIQSKGKIKPIFIQFLNELPDIINDVVQDQDLVLMLGAGDIGLMAKKLPSVLFPHTINGPSL